MKEILVVADMWEGQVRPVTRELVSAAFYIRERAGASDRKPVIRLVVPSETPATTAEDLAGQTGLDTLASQWPCPVTPETLTEGLADILAEAPVTLVLMAHTTLGRETAPRLAVRLGWDAVSGVSAICADDTGLIFDRPVMDNTKIQSVHLPGSQSCVVTLVPGSVGTEHFPENAGEPRTVSTRRISVQAPAVFRRELAGPQESDTEDMGGPDIRTAPIVVGAGQGIGEPENLDKVFAFAGRLPGAAVGASRPLVDRGIMPYHRQVGITGAVISPDLYIACGISGSSQHLAGMAGAKWVVSINTSADAPICRHADLCIQADVTEFISAFPGEN